MNDALNSDPMGGNDALMAPQQPRPPDTDHVGQAFQQLKNFIKGGVSEVLRGNGVKLPDWSNRISDFMQSEPVNAALGVTTPMKSGMVGAASKAVPLPRVAGEVAGETAPRLHPDVKQELIQSLYGDASGARDAAAKAANARDTHRMEQEAGFYLVNDPAARAQDGLPPIPDHARPMRPGSGVKAIPGGPYDPTPAVPVAPPATVQPDAPRGWLQSLMDQAKK